MKAEVELYNFAYNSMICKVANNTDTLQGKKKIQELLNFHMYIFNSNT